MLLLTPFLFFWHTLHYPKNNSIEYSHPLISSLAVKNSSTNDREISFYEENGSWFSRGIESSIVFDMKGYLFPRKYVQAYFVRQFQFFEVNKRKMPLIIFIDGRVNLKTANGKKEISLLFYKSGRVTRIPLIKNNKVNSDFIVRAINASPFWYSFLPYGNRHTFSYRHLDETIYSRCKKSLERKKHK